VSPVSTVTPGLKSSSTASMMAKSRICRWRSMALALVGQPAQTPVKFRAQQPEVIVAGRMQQRDRAPASRALEPPPRLELPEHAGIAGYLGTGLTLSAQAYVDA